MQIHFKNILSSFPILIIVGIWPFVNFFIQNKGEAYDFNPLYVYAVLFVFFLLTTLAFTAVIFHKYKKPIFWACLISVCSILFTTFQPFSEFLIFFGISRPKYILLCWIFLFLLIVYLFYIALTNQSFLRFFKIAVYTLGAVSILNLAVVFYPNLKNYILENKTDFSSKSIDVVVDDIETLPNIYHFILDEYGREDYLKKVLGFDNSEFLGDMKKYGFYTANESSSNYIMTNLSILSLLSMKHPYSLGEGGTKFPKVSVNYYEAKHGKGEAIIRLKGLGYKYIYAFANGKVGGQCPKDVYLCIGGEGGVSELEVALLRMTPLLFPLQAITRDLMNYTVLTPQHVVNKLPAANEGPFFLFAHLLMPHAPWVWNEDCSYKNDAPKHWALIANLRWSISLPKKIAMKYYVDNLKCTNIRIKQAVKNVVNNDPEAIIIIQGDHGTWFTNLSDDKEFKPIKDWSEEEFKERFSILNMFRFPEKCRKYLYPSITLVNTFPVVMACLTKKNPILEKDMLIGKTYAGIDKDNVYVFSDKSNLQPIFE